MDMSVVKTLGSSDDLIDIENHFKLFAGPGAGKTSFLINHINNIILNSKRLGISKKIACITYTNTGVNTIKNRLNNALDHVEVSTIHSFLYKHVLKPYAWVLNDSYELPLNKIDGHDVIVPRYSIISEWKTQTSQQYIKDNYKLSKELSRLKWSMNPDLTCSLRIEYGSNLQIRNTSLIEYKKLCWINGLISHDDVLFLAFEILKHSVRIQDIIRAKFPYIIVDEFQDTNPIQAEILRMIGVNESVVGVIGDVAQSIYSFQGAAPEKFIEFSLDNLKQYKIENNHRSTEEVVKVLNYIRNEKEFNQESLRMIRNGPRPKIVIGDPYEALKKAIGIAGTSDVCTLTYRNEISCKMKNSIEYEIQNIEFNELFYNDSNDKRRWIIAFLILSIENAQSRNYKDAIKYMKKAYRKVEGFSSKDALSNLKRLIDCYDSYKELTVKEFYNSFVFDHYGVKGKITSGKTSIFYGNLKYQSVVLGLGLSEDDCLFKTIHKAKGEEYENVLLIIPEEDEDKSLEFIFNQDILNKQDHRVYYVACSRAEKNLFINVPCLSDEKKTCLEEIGFEVV